MREIKIGKFYKHFKGNIYKVINIAKDSETEDLLVIYEAQYGEHTVWARPYDMFNSRVDTKKYPEVSQEYRFEEYDERKL